MSTVYAPDDSRDYPPVEWNATSVDFGPDVFVHVLFEEHARNSPAAIAVAYEGSTYTYEELNRRANQLAHHLIDAGIRPDDRVAICMDRSLEMVVSVMGILKAGAGYVPLDPNYPLERLRYMLEDSTPKMLLVQSHLMEKLPRISCATLALDSQWDLVASHPSDNVDTGSIGLHRNNVAYMIYTSGSTGKPKGVLNEHAALMNRLKWMQAEFGLGVDDRILQKTPFGFDVSVWEFIWPLMMGARLVMARPMGHQDPIYMSTVIADAGITTIHFTPSMLQVFLSHCSREQCGSLKRIVCSGEALPLHFQVQCLSALPDVELYNLYGPTEAAIDVTYWRCLDEPGSLSVPIGRPIANIQMHILDADMNPVAIGEEGEIYIAGTGVARGYLGRPQLTAERFVPDPLGTQPGGRMYRTGDKGRWRLDGSIDYLGRNDDQVKIFGIRIELGEIEAQLLQHPRLHEVVVTARAVDGSGTRLVAYFTSMDREALRIDDLRAHLKARLPEYMIPTAWVRLDSLPLTPNGKLDRNNLPAPDSSALLVRAYDPPQGTLEEELAATWQELLGVERVGRQDNFFELGGHSLLVMSLMGRLRKLGFTADSNVFFTSSTLHDLATQLRRDEKAAIVPANLIPDGSRSITPDMLTLIELSPTHIAAIAKRVVGGVENIQDIYPLSPLQEGVLFHRLMSGSGDDYIVPTLYAIDTRERLDDFAAALQASIDRHDILRSAVFWEDLPQPVQVLHRKAPLQVVEVDIPSDVDTLDFWRQRMAHGALSIDVNVAPLMRLEVARDEARGRWCALLVVHHLIEDATSLQLLMSEVAAVFDGVADDKPVPMPYREFVSYALADDRRSRAKTFFDGMLAHVHEPTAPFGVIDVTGGSTVDEALHRLDDRLQQRLRSKARDLGVSPAVLFHAAWALVVSRCSGKSDVIFGSVFSGRLHGPEGMDRALGAFINTVPLQVNLQGQSVLQLAQAIQQALVALLPYEQSSLAEAQRCSAVPAGLPLFTALFNYRHTPSGVQELERFGIRELMSRDQTNYPFTMAVDDSGDALVLKAQTDSSIPAVAVLTMMETALASMMHALETDPDSIALELAVLPETTAMFLQEAAAGPTLGQQRTPFVHQLFEHRAQEVPTAVALIHAGVTVSYQELNQRSNKLANYLIGRGVGPGKLVAMCLDRGVEMVVGLLAILKAGGACLPLDPTYPIERIRYMLDDAAPHAMLTQEALRLPIEASGLNIIAIDSQWDEISLLDDGNILPAAIGLGAADLAYVIYTSGSTGRPKGVMVGHRALVNMLGAMQAGVRLESDECLLAITTVSFDIAALEIYWPLVTGAKVAIASREQASDAYALAEAMDRLDVTVMQATPATWQMLLDSGWAGRPSMRALCGGEALSVSLSGQLGSRTKDLYNLYGPTETTVWSCLRKVHGHADARKGGYVSIGRPLANTQVHVLNGDMQPVPIGVSGELYISGAGVARGYLNHPRLTAERFVPDSFSTVAGARMYRTGDLARWRSDGQLDYLGRNDQQVKIRGFRVELGEIEAQLALFPGLRECAVLAVEDGAGGKRLVAYIVMSPGVEPGVDALRAYLKTTLPDHMIPSAWVRLGKLPLTPNGKLDRKALRSPDDNVLISHDFEAPNGQMEEELADIWRELLRVDRVGRLDNFFDLGGHSLLAVRLLSRLRQWVPELTLFSIFQYPTIKAMAELILSGSLANSEKANPVLLRGGTAPHPLFFVHEVSGQAFPYVSLARLFKGDMPVYCLHMGDADKDDFSTTMESLARRHIEAMRRVQPCGPYHLAGWSFGAILAYEIVNQLLQANERVDFLGLIDAQAPSTEKQIYRPDGAGAAAALFVEYLSLLHPSMGDDALTSLRKLPDLPTVLAECWRLGYLDREVTPEAIQSIMATSLVLLNCADHYEPPRLSIPINLYTGSATAAAHDFGGWQSLVGERVKSVAVGGTHLSIMRLPHVQDLARAISHKLSVLPSGVGQDQQNIFSNYIRMES